MKRFIVRSSIATTAIVLALVVFAWTRQDTPSLAGSSKTSLATRDRQEASALEEVENEAEDEAENDDPDSARDPALESLEERPRDSGTREPASGIKLLAATEDDDSNENEDEVYAGNEGSPARRFEHSRDKGTKSVSSAADRRSKTKDMEEADVEDAKTDDDEPIASAGASDDIDADSDTDVDSTVADDSTDSGDESLTDADEEQPGDREPQRRPAAGRATTAALNRQPRDNIKEKSEENRASSNQKAAATATATVDEAATVADDEAADDQAADDEAADEIVATGETGDGSPGDKRLEGPQAPALVVEKVAPKEIQVGKPTSFETRVRNTGTTAVAGVEIHDLVPRGARLAGTTPPSAKGDDGDLVWTVGTLKPGAEITVRMELIPVTEGEIGSVATVRFKSEASARSIVTRPRLKLEVTSAQQALVGTDITFSIKLTNIGTGAATGVMLTENVPDALQHASGSKLEYDIGVLQPRESRDLDLVMKGVKPGVVTNQLEARIDGKIVAKQESELEITAPALQVRLQGPKRRYLERQATYTITVANPGTASAKDVELSAVLPKGLKFIQCDNQGEYDSNRHSVHWSLAELVAKDKGAVTLTLLPTAAGDQPLRVEGLAEQGLADAVEESVTVEGLAALLFQVTDLEDPIEVGGETTYEIQVVNQGSKEASNVRVVCLVPKEIEIISADGPTRHTLEAGEVRFAELPKLAPKGESTFTLRARGKRPGDARLKVQIQTDDSKSPVTKEESTKVYSDEVEPSPGSSDDSAEVGDSAAEDDE